MPRPKLHNPHDRLIKITFRRRRTAASFFQAYLPEDLSAVVDWKTLQVKPGSFVDSQFQAQETDLLFQVSFREEPLYLYCLFEHQSTNDPWMGLRLLGYLHAIWKEAAHVASADKRLPPIVPVVLYQSVEPWTAPLRWRDALTLPTHSVTGLEDLTLDFRYHLVDLSQLSPEEIRGDIFSRLTLGLMKAVMTGNTIPWVKAAGPLLRELSERKNTTEMLEVLLRYLLAGETQVSYQKVVSILRDSSAPEIGDQAMSIAEQLIEKGEKQGFEKGQKNGEMKGQILLLEELLGVKRSRSAGLDKLSFEELQQKVAELRKKLGKI